MKKDNDKILSRREFFQKTVQKTLPIMGVFMFGQFLTSCGDNLALGSALMNDGSSGTNSGSDSEFNSGNSSGNNSGSNSGGNQGGGSGSGNTLRVSPASGICDGHEYVDLGLSVKWARYNVESSAPEENNARYSPFVFEDGLTWDNYLRQLYLAYGVNVDSGNKINVSGSRFDRVTKIWGNNWSSPTEDQFQELIDNCDRCEFTHNGIKGYLYTSKKNGNSIFFANTSPYAWGAGTIMLRSTETRYLLFRMTKADMKYILDNYSCSLSYNSYDKYVFRAVVSTGADSGGNGNNGGVNDCQYNCSNGCSNDCYGSCDGTCQTSCSGLCDSTCKGLCEGSCVGSCDSACRDNCEFRCDVGCSGWCEYVSI